MNAIRSTSSLTTVKGFDATSREACDRSEYKVASTTPWASPLVSVDSASGPEVSRDVWKEMLRLQCRLSILESSCSRLCEQVSAQHHGHCEHLAMLYGDVGEYLETGGATTVSLLQKILHLVADAHARPPETSSEPFVSLDPIRAVLSNFRREIEQGAAATAAQLELLEGHLAEVRQLAQESVETSRRFAHQLGRQSDDLTDQWGPLSVRMRAEMEEHAKRTEARLEARLAACEKAMHVHMDASLKQHAETWMAQLHAVERRAGETLARQEGEMRQRMDVHRADATARLEEVKTEWTEKLRAESEWSRERVQTIQRDVRILESHRVGVDEQLTHVRRTHADEACVRARQTEAVQKVLAELQHTIEHHQRELESLKAQGSLDGAFGEVRDWLTDLDRRATTRGELAEVASRLEGELGEVKQTIRAVLLRGDEAADASREAPRPLARGSAHARGLESRHPPGDLSDASGEPNPPFPVWTSGANGCRGESE